MADKEREFDKKATGLFAAGVLFGTAGIKLLSSKDAKKVYSCCTAAVLRAKDCIMKTVTKVQENAEDVYHSAKNINKERDIKDGIYEDLPEEKEVKTESQQA